MIQPILGSIFSISLLGIQAYAEDTKGSNRPNILFIIADDLRPELRCYGNNQIISPNIDALAKRGSLFKRHSVLVATCGASRASMLTGRVPQDITGLTNNAFESLKKLRNSGVKPDLNNPNTIVTLPELFKLSGYTTVAIGKISHLAHKGDLPGAWDREFSYLSSSRYPEQKIETGNLKQRLTAKMIDAPDTAFTDGLVTQSAIKELQHLKSDGNPFFLGVGFHLPHLPFYAPKRYWDLYDRNNLNVAGFNQTPKNCKREISLHENFELRGQYTQLNVPDPETEARILRHGYYACTSFVDEQIGKICTELDRLGLSENTIIVIWGDNGFHLGDYGIWGKHTCFDLALNTPLIIVDPKAIKKGIVINGMSDELDIYPTLAELCNIQVPEQLNGRSLVPMMHHPQKPGKKIIKGYLSEGEWRHGEPMGETIRTNRYRLVQWRDRKTNNPLEYVELYDHRRDPGETVNIADQHPVIVARIRKMITPVQFSK
jgi:iduronate 2-sulfatase